MLLHDERVQLVEYCRRMQADELTVGTSGNLSVRSGDHIAITPSGAASSAGGGAVEIRCCSRTSS
jgi:L-fuculose-phosphate aldolase